MVAGFEAVEQARLAPPAISLTYFEAGTLCALWCLVQQPLDLAVLEVGLGGRLDAVNIVDADVAIVTTIAQDHASFLGTDIAQIGREKAGIFRSGRPAVLGSRELPESVLDVAKALQTPVYQLGSHFNQEGEPTARWCWQGCTTDGDPLSLDALPDPGLPLDNAATALQALVLSGLSLAVAPLGELWPIWWCRGVCSGVANGVLMWVITPTRQPTWRSTCLQSVWVGLSGE